jgi:hypothetical protein
MNTQFTLDILYKNENNRLLVEVLEKGDELNFKVYKNSELKCTMIPVKGFLFQRFKHEGVPTYDWNRLKGFSSNQIPVIKLDSEVIIKIEEAIIERFYS